MGMKDIVLDAAERRVKQLKQQRADRITIRVSITITAILVLIALAGCTATPNVYNSYILTDDDLKVEIAHCPVYG